jgi:mannose-6-phosphate isomerase-like protein (cupin superfamily)
MAGTAISRKVLLVGVASLMVMVTGASPRAEIKDVMKSADIDAALARAKQGEQVLHEQPNYSIVAGVREGKALPAETRSDAGTIFHVRKGGGKFVVSGRSYDIAAGDVLHAPRNAPYQIDPAGGRIEYLAIRVKVKSNATSRGSGGSGAGRGGSAPRMMPDVIKKDVIDSTFANNSENQPIGSTGTAAYSTNYVIYAGRQPPWESHAACVDLAVVKAGSGVTQVGGTIVNPKEETPGEFRGTGVTGARDVPIAVGDIVVLPKGTPHHQQPKMPRLGYMLVKVWTN